MSRFAFGRGWVLQDEVDDAGAAGGGAGAGEADPNATGTVEGGAQDDKAPAGEKTEEAPKDMKSAIDAALGYKKGPNGEDLDPLTGKPKEQKPAEKPAEKPAAGEGKETETHHANGKPKKSEKGEDLDADGKVVPKQAPKPKTAAELDLKPEEKKGLHAKTQARFAEVINTLKERETAISTLTETNKTLAEARDAILGVMQETKTTQEQLVGYLEFNAMLHSNDPKQIEQALQLVERQRVALMTVLGREADGVDLLKDFPDLAEDVNESRITRERALEIAQGRRDKAARDAAAKREQEKQRTQTQSAEQRKQASEAALTEIEKWTAGLAKTDLDYKSKEDRLLAKVEGVIKNYPPNLWLSTLKMMYEGIEIQKAPMTSGQQTRPLRPSGAKPGDKAPSNMKEAIDQGLGYAGAQKG